MKKIKVLITAGPTLEMIDPVRYISNLSSGKQGYEIANHFIKENCDVTLVSGPVQLDDPEQVKLINVNSASEMLDACMNNLPADIFIACAAVCDWKPINQSKSKLKKTKEQKTLTLEFVKNPDILFEISNLQNNRPKVVIGFAAETDDLINNARSKLFNKKCDAIFANDVSSDKVFGKDNTHLHLLTRSDYQDLVDQPKTQSAKQIVQTAMQFLQK